MPNKKWNRKTVRNIGITLANRFNYEELRNLTSDLGIDYGDLEGGIQDTKARSLVKYMYRRNRLDELIEVGKMSRTDIDWDALIVPYDPTDADADETFSEEDFDFVEEDEPEINTSTVLLSNTLAPTQPHGNAEASPIWQQRPVQIGGGALGFILVALLAFFGLRSDDPVDVGPESMTLGTTIEGNFIRARRYGGGTDAIIFVGGMHSGKSPATTNISDELNAFLATKVNTLPRNLAFYVIEDLNPDSVDALGQNAGRVNGQGVDPNRNGSCNWQAGDTNGTEPFSEEETQALKRLVDDLNVVATVFWAARETNGGVYPAFCNGQDSGSQELAELFAGSTGYSGKRVEELRQGSGELADWMASENVATITVLFRDHTDPDWSRQQRAVERLIQEYGE